MEKTNEIQPLATSGPCRGLIKAVAEETGQKYTTVRWQILVSKKRNPAKDRFLELAAEIAAQDAAQKALIEQLKLQFSSEPTAKAS